MKPLLLLQPNAFVRRLYPGATWHFTRKVKSIYLTFDDGPIPELTDWVLDELKKFNAKATFFCVGDNVRKNPSVFARIKNEGHQVANHTMRHVKGFKHSLSTYMREVNDCETLVNTKLFRPPYGQLKRGQYKALLKNGFKIVYWDVISYDYEKISKEACLKNVLSASKAGSVVLFHDNVKAQENMKYALPNVLQHFTEAGYTFKSL